MKGKKMQNQFKAYMINCNVLNANHSYVTAKTQAEATQMAYEYAVKEGRKNIEVVGNNVEFN